LVDGISKGTAAGSGTSWNFSWPISSLYDGDYLVSAQAYDQYGSPGPAKVATYKLNRRQPYAPPGFTGGWDPSFSYVEFEWLPNAEGDIEGYRVYRNDPTGPTLVCGLQLETTCKDTSPIDQLSTDYWVVAVDKDEQGAYREGDKSAKAVIKNNKPPNPPTKLTATTEPDGNIKLSWTAPNPADPDPTDYVDFYRIYRDGTAIADRYSRTAPGATTFTDGGTGGTKHDYYVSAVDNHYAESTLVGPVTP
jgi:fibronectin type 3 domain-containing protein